MKTKYYISTDLEGLACVCGSGGHGLYADSTGYDFACREAVAETNAAVGALFDSGATAVYVWDSHGTGVNMDYHMLDPRVNIVMGAGSGIRFPCIDGTFGGVLFLGAHAYDTENAVLSHVYSSAELGVHKINGIPVGEMQIDGAIAGKKGVPVIFASGDDICVSQAKASFGDIQCVITKKALAFNQCISRNPSVVCGEIYSAVKRAVGRQEDIPPYVISEPFDLEVNFKSRAAAEKCRLHNPCGTPFEYSGECTRRGVLSHIEEYFK